MLRELYQRLPSSAQPLAKNLYENVISNNNQPTNDQLIEDLFSSEREFDNYSQEFEDSDIHALIDEKVGQFRQNVEDDRGVWAGIGLESAKLLYAIVLKYEPSVIIETGVCNGVSSLIILSALDQNQAGNLYSIDYPMYADEPLPEFRETAYPEGHAFSAIPSDKEPGWIIPETLRDRWDLRIGKSQRKLPELITEFDEIDLFIHDSEHTHPCMMFEYEIAWEWLKKGGILLSDDIQRNDSFNVFTDVREPEYFGIGTLGYAKND
jgi:predicted O-methyltransferase YrrM